MGTQWGHQGTPGGAMVTLGDAMEKPGEWHLRDAREHKGMSGEGTFIARESSRRIKKAAKRL